MDGWRIIYRRTTKNSVMVFLLLLWFLIDINPNPHGRGHISPYYIFSKASTQKVLKCHKSTKISYSKKNFCWIDILGYVCFMPQNRLMPEEIWANSVYHLSRLSYFCPHPGGGREGIEVEGKQPYLHTEQKAIHIKNTTIYSLIVGLTDLWALFTWTKRCSIL